MSWLTTDCTEPCWTMPWCKRCGLRKKPRGRSAPPEMTLCDHDCPGYVEEPRSGHLWPSEGRVTRQPNTKGKAAPR